MKVVFVAIALFAAVSLASEKSVLADEKDDFPYLSDDWKYYNESATVKIVNGFETGNNQWRGVVQVRAGGLCTGAFIHPRLVTTAAHCCSSGMTIRGGATGGTLIASVSQYQSFGSGQNDFCLLYLDRAVSGYPMYELAGSLPSGAGTIVGYGVNVQGYPQTGSGTRRYGNIRVTSASGYNIYVTNNNGSSRPQNACNGDSGGPLFTSSGGRLQMSGVTSRGSAGCPANGSVIYTSINGNAANIRSAAARWGITVNPGQCATTSCCYNANC